MRSGIKLSQSLRVFLPTFGKKERIIFLRVTRNVLRSVESELVPSPLF